MIWDFSNFSEEELLNRRDELMKKLFLMISEPEVVTELSVIERELERRKVKVK